MSLTHYFFIFTQEPWKAIPSSKEPATSRPIASDSNEDDDWLPRVHPKSQDKKQRQKHKVMHSTDKHHHVKHLMDNQ